MRLAAAQRQHRRELASGSGRHWSQRRSGRSIVVVLLVGVAVLLSGCITSFTPSAGPSAGHTRVVISGTTFLGATSVKFGATNATWFHVTSATTITAMTKAHAPGSVKITVVTPNGTFRTSGSGFTFVAPTGPAYDSLIPLNGGDPYTQDQTFAGAFAVEFGNEVNLATSGQVTNVVVGMRNWGAAVSELPITLTLYNPRVSLTREEMTGPGTVITSVTQDFNVPAELGATESQRIRHHLQSRHTAPDSPEHHRLWHLVHNLCPGAITERRSLEFGKESVGGVGQVQRLRRCEDRRLDIRRMGYRCRYLWESEGDNVRGHLHLLLRCVATQRRGLRQRHKR